MRRTKADATPSKEKRKKLSAQVVDKTTADRERVSTGPVYSGSEQTISTGSTLLDLAISGGRFTGGGIPLGILVEIFGPAGSGKTVLLSQIAANLQRQGGKVMFHDPEARLNEQFAAMFGLVIEEVEYTTPNTIGAVFKSVRSWDALVDGETVGGVFADSLAALSTDMEMDKEEGDKMGMRRAKEFSEELRKTARILSQKNALMVCSNQIRQNMDAGPYGQKHKSPGGQAIGFYSSLRLRTSSPQKIKLKKTIRGTEHERVAGVKVTIDVFKSSIWKPHRSADVYILFDYGVDDIRANLKFVKAATKNTSYAIGEEKLGRSLDEAILVVESQGLEQALKEEVINLWNEIEEEFTEPRKPREV